MMKTVLFLGLLFAAVEASRVTPVQKVLQLMEGMVAKGEADKQAEQVQFAAYAKWCKQTSTSKFRAINEASEAIQNLQADIEKQTSDAKYLTRAIKRLDEDISEIENDVKSATKMRAAEHDEFLQDERDAQESVEQMGTATSTVEAEAHDTAQASAALVQVSKLALLDDKDRAAVTAFLSMTDEDRDAAELGQMGAPSANAAEFASDGILQMFGKLSAKFEGKLAALREQEMENKHAYDMLMMDQKHAKDQAETDRAEKSASKGKAQQAAGEAKSDLADTVAAKAADEKFKSDLDSTCAQKAGDFENRQKLRTEELEAVNKAIEILGGDAVAGSSDKHLPALVQKKATLAQLRASTLNPNQARVVAFLKEEATRINSRVLSAVSMRASYDPFKSVKKMIKDMVVKLMEEANEEAEHKGWCDTELSTNEQTRKEKTGKVELLTAEVDELTATVNQLSAEIAQLSKDVADLDSRIKEATQIRADEKAKNAATIKDAKAAQEAVGRALAVLKDFYEKAGEATSLVQKKGKALAAQPAIFDSSYQGMGSSTGGVVGMIEVIQSDFERLETTTDAAEVQAQKEFDEFMNDSASDKDAKATEAAHLSAKKQNKEQQKVERSDDLLQTQKELDAAVEYYEKLKPSCVDAGVSYEERVARRKEEIGSLQEALKIINGEDLAVFVQKK